MALEAIDATDAFGGDDGSSEFTSISWPLTAPIVVASEASRTGMPLYDIANIERQTLAVRTVVTSVIVAFAGIARPERISPTSAIAAWRGASGSFNWVVE